MAVRAGQRAFARLLPTALERPSDPSHPEPERLLARVEVVELQRADVAVVATQLAAATGLCHEQRLDLAPSSNHAVTPALLAAVVILRAVPHEVVSRTPDTHARSCGRPSPRGRAAREVF